MTPAERKALGFLLAVAAVGTAVRAGVATRDRVPPSAVERAALDAQLAVVDSARAARDRGRARGGGRTRPRAARAARGAAAAPPAPDTARWPAAVAVLAAERGPPSGVARVERARRTAAAPPPATAEVARAEPSAPVSLDAADSAALEGLPGVGPALARRIVAERAARGPFGSVEALAARVRGVGPRLAERLRPHVAEP